MPPKAPEQHHHGPENAEHELKKAYNATVETGIIFAWHQNVAIEGVSPNEVTDLYKEAFRAYRDEDRLAAERWARTVKHLARAFKHEAKIAYLEPRASDLPYLENALAEYGLHDHSDTTEDLLESVADHIPPGLDTMPEEMTRYIARGRLHLEKLRDPGYTNELLRADRIMAAHEYGRVCECLALAYEAVHQGKKAGEAA